MTDITPAQAEWLARMQRRLRAGQASMQEEVARIMALPKSVRPFVCKSDEQFDADLYAEENGEGFR